jgi:hypothetical protein
MPLAMLSKASRREARVEGRLVDQPRRDAVDAHAVRCDLLGDGLAERDHRALGRGVGERPGAAAVPGRERRQVHDRPLLARDHARDGRLHAPEHARQVRVDHLAPQRLGHLHERAPLHEVAGVVDEHVEPPERALDALDEPARLVELGQVGHEQGRLAVVSVALGAGGAGPRARDELGGLLGALAVAEVVNGDLGAPPRQLDRGGAADAAARAGDQRALSLQTHGD